MIKADKDIETVQDTFDMVYLILKACYSVTHNHKTNFILFRSANKILIANTHTHTKKKVSYNISFFKL